MQIRLLKERSWIRGNGVLHITPRQNPEASGKAQIQHLQGNLLKGGSSD